MAAGMGLHLAGIDLRQTPRGEWYCLEVNPSPGFTYYEAVTGQPIAAAVAELLVRQDANCWTTRLPTGATAKTARLPNTATANQRECQPALRAQGTTAKAR